MTIAGRRYRVKARSRFIFFITLMIILTVMTTTTLMGFNNADGLTSREYIEITVEPGDTLWNLAREHMPNNTDIRRAVHTLTTLNDIAAHELRAGQTIVIPVW